jgi:clan AA aspartic protease
VTGRVEDLKPILPVTFIGTEGNLSLDFVIDTGFTDFLTLPVAAVRAMGLPIVNRRAGRLADGSVTEFDVYAARILWNTEERIVPVLAIGTRPLLGTSLLSDCKVTIYFTPSGAITVEPA